MAYDIELKEDSPEKLAAVAGKPTKYSLFAAEFMAFVDYVNGLDLQQILEVGGSSTLGVEVAGLTLSGKINFVTSLITALRNVSFQDKDGVLALISDITALSQTIPSKQSAELLLLNADVVQSGGLPKISGLTKQGHTLTQNSRVVVTDYNVPAFNGFYRVGTGPIIGTGEYLLVRTSDANTSASLNNAIVSITNGTFAGKTYKQTSVNPVVGTTPINFVEFGGNTVENATDILAGISKLYNALGIQTDGGVTPKAVNDALELKADLIGGLIPSSQLPAYVDDLLEFANLAAFPATGEVGKIYIAVSPKNLQYRWSGSAYIAVTNGLIASTNDVPEGLNLYYTEARVNALLSLFKTANFLDATSSIQNQLNAKQNTLGFVSYATATTTVGWSSFAQKTLWYIDLGTHCLYFYHLEGPGNGINSSFTIHFNATENSTSQHIPMSNGSYFNNPGRGSIASGSNIVNLFATLPGSTWSAGSSTKIASGFILIKK